MIVEIDGAPASAEAWRDLALEHYGHFTAMQVRAGRTRGLDLHLRRLDAASRELFGQPLPASLVRDRIRHALRDGRPEGLDKLSAIDFMLLRMSAAQCADRQAQETWKTAVRNVSAMTASGWKGLPDRFRPSSSLAVISTAT